MDATTRRRRAATFDRAADVYDRARPGYPPAAVAWGVAPGARTVLDLGAGTGKLTAALVAAGLDVVAVDPSPRMLARLTAALPAVRTRVGTAEATGVADGAVDAVTVAAAFHWFDRPAADAEIARVLRPGGRVALFWNHRDPGDPTAAAFDRAAREADYRPAPHDEDVELDRRWFGPTERHEFANPVRVTGQRLVEMVASRSYVIDLPDAEHAALLLDVERFAHEELGLSGDDTTTLAMRCVVLRASRVAVEDQP